MLGDLDVNKPGKDSYRVFFWDGQELKSKNVDLWLSGGVRPMLSAGKQQLVDLDDDGVHEILLRSGKRLRRSGRRGGVINAIRSGLNPEPTPEAKTRFPPDIYIEYKWSSDKSVYDGRRLGGCGTFQRCSTPELYFVSVVRFATGKPSAESDSTRRVGYRYSDYRTDISGRGALGVGLFEVEDSERQTSSYFDNRTRLPQLHVYPNIGIPQKTIVTARLDPNTTERREVIVEEFEHRILNSGRSFFTFRKKERAVEALQYRQLGGYLGQPIEARIVKTSRDFDNYGNEVSLRRRSRTSATPELGALRTRTWLWSLLSIEEAGHSESSDRVFDINEDLWLISRLHSETVTNRSAQCEGTQFCPPGGEITRTRIFSYYLEDRKQDLAERVEENGNVPDAMLTTHFTYDQYGNMTTVEASGVADVTGATQARKTAMTFDDFEHSFPSSFTNSLGHVVQTRFDASLGVLVKTVWGDGRVATASPDGFGRIIRHTISGGETVDIDLLPRKKCSISGPSTGCDKPWVSFRSRVTKSGGPTSVVLHDRLGRPTEISQGVYGRSSVRRIHYDIMGRLSKVTVPRFEDETVADEVEYEYRYDPLNRPTTIVSPEGTTSIAYRGLVTSVVDPRGKMYVSVANGLSDPIADIDPAGNANRYEYAAGGQLWRILDAAGKDTGGTQSLPNVTEFTYDSLGRRIGMDHPDFGTTSTLLNAFSELIQGIDAKNQTSNFFYDSLGRIVRQEDGDGRITQWIWDAASGAGIGKMASTVSPDGHVEKFGYDKMGRLNSYELSLNPALNLAQSLFRMELDYYGNGRLGKIRYPQIGARPPISVTYVYDASGLLAGIIGAEDETIWRAQEYDPLGRIHLESLGNGIETRWDYNKKSGRIANIESESPTGAAIRRYSYTYYPGGSLKSRQAIVGSNLQNELFAEEAFYDDLGRFKRIEHLATRDVLLRVDYDAIGNITAKSDVGSYRYDGPQPHAATSAGDSSYHYDHSGNLIVSEDIGFTYQRFGAIATAYNDHMKLSFAYSARRQRILKQAGQEQTVYLPNRLGQVTFSGKNTATTFNIPLPDGRRIASLQTRSSDISSPANAESVISDAWYPFYFLHDNLGSITAVTDNAGATIRRWKYSVHGQRIPVVEEQVTGQELGFTGHYIDEELQLVDAGARRLDPILGRFISPDPVQQFPLSTQNLNAYTYVLNSPLTFTDPTGLKEEPYYSLDVPPGPIIEGWRIPPLIERRTRIPDIDDEIYETREQPRKLRTNIGHRQWGSRRS